jgi:CHAD domain-containing protein
LRKTFYLHAGNRDRGMYQSESGKILYKFYKERDNNFTCFFEKLLLKLDEDNIHNLRRSGKRIKALLKLFDEINPEFNFEKRFSVVKDLFNTAGFYREVQVNLRTLNSYKPSSQFVHAYKDFVSNKKQVFKSQLKTSIEQFNQEKHKKTAKKVKKICQEIDLKDVTVAAETFIKKNLTEIKRIRELEPSEDGVHEIRIHLKRISPVINFLQVLKLQEFENNILEIKVVEDKMGYWHDRAVLLNNLMQMKKLYPIPNNLMLDFNVLMNQLIAENKSFINQISDLVEPCIQKLDAVKFTVSTSGNP